MIKTQIPQSTNTSVSSKLEISERKQNIAFQFKNQKEMDPSGLNRSKSILTVIKRSIDIKKATKTSGLTRSDTYFTNYRHYLSNLQRRAESEDTVEISM